VLRRKVVKKSSFVKLFANGLGDGGLSPCLGAEWIGLQRREAVHSKFALGFLCDVIARTVASWSTSWRPGAISLLALVGR